MNIAFLRHEVASELIRTYHRGVLLGWLGLTASLAVLINTVMFSAAAGGDGGPTTGPGVDLPGLAVLQSRDGLTAGVASASSMLGVVTLAFWALLTATDYGTGIVRLLAVAQPRRWRLLAGKAVALALWTIGASLVALVANLLAAPASAAAVGVDTEAWAVVGVHGLLWAWADLLCALLAWGVLGLALATISRSAAIAISIGVGYVLLLEGVLAAVLGKVADVLPGSVLRALADGGNATLDQTQADALGLLYVAIALAASLLVVQRRDVTD